MRVKQQACLFCGKEVSRKPKKFCDNTCQHEFEHVTYVQEWKLGNRSGLMNNGSRTVSSHVRRFLHEKYKGKCQVCGWNMVHPVNGKCPLQVHHVDGIVTNTHEVNLQLLCPNCHSLTPNYGKLNKASSRKR